MRPTSLRLLGALVLPAPARPGAETPVTSGGPAIIVTESDQFEPPSGSKEDRALWRSGLDTQTNCIAEQERTRSLLADIATNRYVLRLTEIAKAGAPVSKRAEALAQKLATAAQDAHRIGDAPPFNLVTGCKYELLYLGQAMAAKPGSPGAADLLDSREKLAMCRDRLRKWVGPLAARNDRLAETTGEARSFLATDEARSLDPVARASRPPSGG